MGALSQLSGLVLAAALVACGGGATVEDGGGSDAARDSGVSSDGDVDFGAAHEAGVDLGVATDGGVDLGNTADGGVDLGTRDGGRPDGATGCTTDADCVSGAEWCVGGACVACDNGGLVCDIACTMGWSTYMRNGCSPCACAPPNQCTSDGGCAVGHACYAGAFCWDWCPPDDPTCCFGNICSPSGCSGPPPVGCRVRGCPSDMTCGTGGCASSTCACGGGGTIGWGCSTDCGGGTCT